MPKKQYTITLTGYTSKGILANTHQTDQVVLFKNKSNTIHVQMITDKKTDVKSAVVITTDNQYVLPMSSYNDCVFKGELANGIKAHFTKKKLIAKLIYWA